MVPRAAPGKPSAVWTLTDAPCALSTETMTGGGALAVAPAGRVATETEERRRNDGDGDARGHRCRYGTNAARAQASAGCRALGCGNYREDGAGACADAGFTPSPSATAFSCARP